MSTKNEYTQKNNYLGPKNRPSNNKNRFFWRRVLFVCLFFVFIWLAWSSFKIFLTYLEARRNRAFAENQKIEITNEINEINRKIEQVKTLEGTEEYIRTKYPFVKDSERVLIINENDQNKPVKKSGFWQKIKEFF